jgi:hypothetical protein
MICHPILSVLGANVHSYVYRLGNNSPSWFCRRCQIPFEPSDIEIRKKSKLGTQREEVEPAVASVGGVPDVSISHTVPIRSGFAELQKKGLRIKDYRTRFSHISNANAWGEGEELEVGINESKKVRLIQLL